MDNSFIPHARNIDDSILLDGRHATAPQQSSNEICQFSFLLHSFKRRHL